VTGPAGATGASWAPLSDTLLTGSQASFDISGIDQSFKHLIIVASLRTDEAVKNSNCTVTFNGESGGTQYDRYSLTATAGSASVGSLYGQASFAVTALGANADASVFTSWRIEIADYASAIKHTARLELMALATALNADAVLQHSILRHKTAAAVSQVTIAAPSGKNFVSGSRVTIYGMP
jgi:hypothetical protein